MKISLRLMTTSAWKQVWKMYKLTALTEQSFICHLKITNISLTFSVSWAVPFKREHLREVITLCFLWYILGFEWVSWPRGSSHSLSTENNVFQLTRGFPKNTDAAFFTLTNVICFKYSLMQLCLRTVPVAYLLVYSGLLS